MPPGHSVCWCPGKHVCLPCWPSAPPAGQRRLCLQASSSAGVLLNSCCRAQLVKRPRAEDRGAWAGQRKRTVSALLPAVELLLRGTMDLRLKHWQHSSGMTVDALEEARCMLTPHSKCMTMLLS